MKPAPAHILLVEDDRFLRDQLEAALHGKGYSVAGAESLAEGLALAREQIPAVVVCDVRLPDGDGRSLLETMRADPELMVVQFVLMTGFQREVPQRSGMDLGADDFLNKPFSESEFLACIEARLRRAKFWMEALEQKTVDYLRGTVSARLPHEFFTPLAGILGFSELLLGEASEEANPLWHESVQHIQSCAERLNRTLQNYMFILQMMELTPSGRRREGAPLEAVAADLESTARIVAARYERPDELRIHQALPEEAGELPVPVRSNELAKIGEELIDNAFKFSVREQPVEVNLGLDDEIFCLQVQDRGRGLSEEQVAQIGAFRQFDRTRFEQQGLGLGLTIAQHLVERSQGRLAIESSSETGTCVAVRWPLLGNR